MSAQVHAHLQLVSPPHLDGLLYVQAVAVLVMPTQHLPPLPQRPAANWESAWESNLANVAPGDREAQAAEAAENVTKLD